MSKPPVQLVKLGLKSYMPTWKLQQDLVKKVKSSQNVNYLVLVEHKPVYTTGIRSSGYSNEEEERLKKLGADFVRSNRGGLITFHGPGQLVAYPILNLKHFVQSDVSGKRLKLLGMKWYINTLEQVVIQTLKKNFDIEAFRSPDTGIIYLIFDYERRSNSVLSRIDRSRTILSFDFWWKYYSKFPG